MKRSASNVTFGSILINTDKIIRLHRGVVSSVLFYPPSRILSTGSDSQVCVWNVESGGRWRDEGYHYVIYEGKKGVFEIVSLLKWDSRKVLLSSSLTKQILSIDVVTFRERKVLELPGTTNIIKEMQKVDDDNILTICRSDKINLISYSEKKVAKEIKSLISGRFRVQEKKQILVSKNKNNKHFYIPLRYDRRGCQEIKKIDYEKDKILLTFEYNQDLDGFSNFRQHEAPTLVSSLDSFLNINNREILVVNGLDFYDTMNGNHIRKLDRGISAFVQQRYTPDPPGHQRPIEICSTHILNDKYIFFGDKYGRFTFLYRPLDYFFIKRSSQEEKEEEDDDDDDDDTHNKKR